MKVGDVVCLASGSRHMTIEKMYNYMYMCVCVWIGEGKTCREKFKTDTLVNVSEQCVERATRAEKRAADMCIAINNLYLHSQHMTAKQLREALPKLYR